MSKDSQSKHEPRPEPKQIKIPLDGQLSKKGTVIKDMETAKEVDYSIAEIVESINQAGYVSKYSCSGLKKDHPFKDVKPDGAYISFLNQENDVESLTLIQSAANNLNLTAEFCKMKKMPALVVRIDKDKSGNSLMDRIKKSNESTDRTYSSDFSQTQGAFAGDLERILKRSGGLIYDSDDKIESVWKMFCDFLL